jgi:hypothetical protein
MSERLFNPERKTVFERASDLALPLGHYAIVGGAMEAHGIRPARDIDVVVDPELFDDLEQQGWVPYSPKPDFMGETWGRLEKDDVQVNSEISWRGELFAETRDLIDNAEMIEDFPFAPLEILAMWKRARAREKDLRDVELITNYLSKRSLS